MAKTDVLRRVRQNLFSERSVERPFLQEATAPVSTVATTFDVADGTVWEAGDTLEWEETGEQCYVRSVATNTLTVIRGFNGTTAASITDTVPLVRKNPQFTEQEMLDQYDHILNSLWSHGVFAWNSTFLNIAASDTTPWLVSPSSAVVGHEIRARDVIAVIGTSTNDNNPEVHVPFRVHEANGGVEITIPDPGSLDYDQNLNIFFTDRIYDIDTQDIHPEVEQALEDGVTYRLMASTMASRLHDPGQLTDRTVQPGQGGRDARFYQGEFVLAVRRIAQELKVEKANRRVGQDYGTSRARRWRV